MAEARTDQAVDFDELLSKLKAEAEETKKLTEDLSSGSEHRADSGERLIDEMAESLSTLREAVGLPRKDPADFKAAIKHSQRNS